jgi:hypothetical protein
MKNVYTRNATLVIDITTGARTSKGVTDPGAVSAALRNMRKTVDDVGAAVACSSSITGDRNSSITGVVRIELLSASTRNPHSQAAINGNRQVNRAFK